MATLRCSQKNFETLVQTLNHRVTKIERDVMWMKRIGYYMATVLTVLAGKLIIF